MRRRKGRACSSPLNQDRSSRQELKGEVYNIFPYIRDPNPEKKAFPIDRAFTLTNIIDTIFFPFRLEDAKDEMERRPDITTHELAHYTLCSAINACEERLLAAQLLGQAWQMVIDNTDHDVKLLIPSCTIVGPDGKEFILQSIADQLDTLSDAREAVHEIVARVTQVQVGTQYWHRDKAKELIREVVANDLLLPVRPNLEVNPRLR